MTAPGCDVAIAGLGARGSAAAWQLGLRGQRVIGFDRFRPPHDRGSSTGRGRIIREAYWEGPDYVPLVAGARAGARAQGVPRERLSAAEVRRRFPVLQPDDAPGGVLEPRAGVLGPEEAIAGMLAEAGRYGAEWRYDEPVASWEAGVDGD